MTGCLLFSGGKAALINIQMYFCQDNLIEITIKYV